MLALDLARTEAHAKEKERKNLGSPPSPANNGCGSTYPFGSLLLASSNEEVLEHFSKGLRDALSEDNHAKTLQLCKLAKNLPKGSRPFNHSLIPLQPAMMCSTISSSSSSP